jgi:hypothetical protein
MPREKGRAFEHSSSLNTSLAVQCYTYGEVAWHVRCNGKVRHASIRQVMQLRGALVTILQATYA